MAFVGLSCSKPSSHGMLLQVDVQVAASTSSKGGKARTNVKNAQQRYRERQKVGLCFRPEMRTRWPSCIPHAQS